MHFLLPYLKLRKMKKIDSYSTARGHPKIINCYVNGLRFRVKKHENRRVRWWPLQYGVVF